MDNFVIKRKDGSTFNVQSRSNVSKITRASQSVEMLENDTVDMTVESAVKMVFSLGSKITILGRDYTLNVPGKERKISDNHFQYDLQFEGVQYDLTRATYDINIDTTGSNLQSESLTGDMKLFLDVLIANISRIFPGKWILGTYPENTEVITLTFGDADNCLSVLQTLCEKYKQEFSIDIDNSEVRTINIGVAGKTFEQTFEYGRVRGIYELSREKVSSSNIVTRLKVFGSARNITSKYRSSRLLLPGKTKPESYLEDAVAIAKYGIWENTKIFEEVYPHRTGVVSDLGDSVLKFVDSSMSFDLNEKEADGVTTKYLLSGIAAKVHFNTGNLAGYEFDIQSYDHTTKTFKIKSQTDQNDYTFPSETSAAFQIAVGDEYVLLDIALPQSYVDTAEAELLAKGAEYLDQNSQPKVQYSLELDSFYLAKMVGDDADSNLFWVGDYIPIKDSDIEVDKLIRIKGFTRDLLKDYSYKLTISDISVTKSAYTRIISELIDIDKVIKINNLKDPARARRNYLNAQEVLGMVFDPEGDFYSEKIKPESIDTVMLSVGAKSIQFGLIDTVLQPNYGGDKNRIVYKGGILIHYTILDSSDVSRSWNITDGDQTLLIDGQAYYIYMKCERVGTAGSIIFSTSQITVDSDALYYHFWIGVINSVDASTNTRAISLTYGFTTINGRYITTGRIQSADGLNYFDLDDGEFKGKFTFTSGTDVEDAVSNAQETATDAKNYIENTLPSELSGLQSQIDGQIIAWFQEFNPTTANYPANEWTSETLKLQHANDTFTNTLTGGCWRWQQTGGVWGWGVISDTATQQALTAASRAQSTADGKRRVFVSTPTTPYDIGDLWINGADLKRCSTAKTSAQSYNSADWILATSYDNTKTVIDGGIVTSGTVQVAGDASSILAGITGQGTLMSAIRFWAGKSFAERATAPFRVQQDGKVYMTNAEVEGVIKALSGQLGGFELANGRIGVEQAIYGLSIYNSFIKFSNENIWAGIGENVLPSESGLVGVGRFSNNTPNPSGTNVGVLLQVTGANHNIALPVKGNVAVEGVNEGYNRYFLSPAGNVVIIPAYASKRVIVQFAYGGSGIGFPSRYAVAGALGINTSTPFLVKFTIICDRNSTYTGNVWGRNNTISGMSSTEYPQLIDNNSTIITSGISFSKSDIFEVMLDWDGYNYVAYILNRRE